MNKPGKKVKMASIRSIRAGLSKSYQSLNTLGSHDNANDDNLYDRSSTTDWIGVDNFKTGKNANSPFAAFKTAMSRVSRGKQSSSSRISVILKELDDEWRIQEEPSEGENFLGKLRRSSSKMPSSVALSAEQASLLGTMPSDALDDVDLRHVQLSVANARTLSEDGSAGNKETVETRHGPITVAISGDTSKPVILTYHDLGLNHVTNFQAFFLYPEMRNIINNFCIVHVNAPGQEEGAPTLPEGYVYPTMEELSETITAVKSHFHIRTFIGFGVGLGANILSRYATKYPADVDALVLINCSSTQAGWIEWGYQKLNIRHLRSGTMTTGTVDYLLWHHFGKLEECNQDLVTVYRQHFEKALNATNLGLLVDSYIRRTDLSIVRELDPNKKKDVRMIRTQVLNITANHSPHVDDTVTFNGRLDPTLSTWMKIQDCGLVIDEAPGKVVEAFRLFLQGQGYAVHSRGIGSRQASLSSVNGSTTSVKDIRITENPLQNPTV
ncbi:protein NDRG3-like isoform X2 [Penaeus japonicus]|uniref:protein NDRG3-like isoform X2 n=1 Tax=Penaeus japonicus TaxID=27405 RepID=UPI001C70BBCB|nr:protein NDRG3-like isoform X2 [Penaeus japonicus]